MCIEFDDSNYLSESQHQNAKNILVNLKLIGSEEFIKWVTGTNEKERRL